MVPLRAGVSSFGAGGANVHIILEEYATGTQRPVSAKAGEFNSKDCSNHKRVFIFSAQSQQALHALMKRYSEFLDAVPEEAATLERLSYNLQMGRKEHAHRLAIIAQDRVTLSSNVLAYINGKKSVNIIIGDVQVDIANAFRTDGDAKEVMEHLLAKKSWLALATLWVKGAQVEWRKVFNNKIQKLSMPSYPFDGEEYWLPRTVNVPARDTLAPQFSLPGYRTNAPGVNGIVYSSTLSLSSLPYLAHHKIFDQALVPGSWYIALALTVLKSEQPTVAKWELVNCTFQETLQVDDSTQREVSCVIKHCDQSGNQDKQSLEIYSRDASSERAAWVLLFSGFFDNSASVAQEPIKLDLQDRRRRCDSVMDVDDFYNTGSRLGFSWSGPFKALKKLQYREGEAIGYVVNEKLMGDTGSLVISPALLDACFQVCLAALAVNKRHDNEAFIPISVDRIEMHGEVDEYCYSSGRMIENGRDHAVVFDSDISRASGELLLRFEGLCAYRITAENLRRQRDGSNALYDSWFYSPQWKSINPESSPSELLDVSVLAVSQTEQAMPEALRAAWKAADRQFRVLQAHDHEFTQHLADWIVQSSTPAVISVFFNASAHQTWGTVESWQRDIEQTVSIVRSVLNQISNTSRSITLWLITTDSQAIAGNSGSLTTSAIWGLSRSLAYEYPHLWGGLIDLPRNPSTEDGKLLRRVLLTKPDEDQVAIRNGELLALRLGAIGNTLKGSSLATISADAQYLITGGLGSIGQVHMRWLLDSGAGHVSLLGRSVVNDSVLKSIQEHYGDQRVSYHSVDISNEKALQTCLASLNEQALPIKGLIHTAGMLADRIFENSGWDDFEKAFSGKVFGALNLLNCLPLNAVDFVVFTSTASAMLGSPGQSNYTMANAYLDAMAQALQAQGVPAISVNWGPWQDTGMVHNMSEQAKQTAQLTTGKYGGVCPDNAKFFFEKLYSADLAQAIVLPEGWRQLASPLAAGRVMSTWREEQINTSKRNSEKVVAKAQSIVTTEPIEQVLRRSVIDVLGYASDFEFEFNRSFQQLGFDSLSAMKLRNHLNERLSVTLPATSIFDFPNPDALIEYIEKELLENSPLTSDKESITLAPAMLTKEVASLSQEEADQLLQQELESLSG